MSLRLTIPLIAGLAAFQSHAAHAQSYDELAAQTNQMLMQSQGMAEARMQQMIMLRQMRDIADRQYELERARYLLQCRQARIRCE